MKRVLFALLFLLSAGNPAWSQQSLLSPTINYQGRAHDGTMPVTGQHQVTLTIYDAATDGNALFTETHSSVNFSDAGIFTVVIGGATPGGIPSAVGFEDVRWLGVAISGFNGGNEIPRLRFHGSPYSIVSGAAQVADSSRVAFRAEQADRADRADNADNADSARAAFRADMAIEAETALVAKAIEAPLSLENASDEPTLTLTGNEGKGTGLLVVGRVQVRGEINSTGVSGTTEHFVAGGSAGGEEAPAPGALYRDNTPIAWGQVQADGSLLADFGIKSVKHEQNSPGLFVVELENSLAVDGFNRPAIAVVVTPQAPTGATAAPIFGVWNFSIDEGTNQPKDNSFEVFIRDMEQGQDLPFSVVVFGRPAN